MLVLQLVGVKLNYDLFKTSTEQEYPFLLCNKNAIWMTSCLTYDPLSMPQIWNMPHSWVLDGLEDKTVGQNNVGHLPQVTQF